MVLCKKNSKLKIWNRKHLKHSDKNLIMWEWISTVRATKFYEIIQMFGMNENIRRQNRLNKRIIIE